MQISNAFASLAVTDLDNACRWYERFLGDGDRPMATLAEWTFASGGGLQVYVLPERAGNGSCTLVVDDVDATAADLQACGIVEHPEVMRGDLADTVMVRDPDGNSIAFAEQHSPDIAR